MMDFEKLLDPYPVKKEAELIAQSIANEPKQIQTLWEFAKSDAKTSRRAAWLIDKVYDIAPELIRPYVKEMITLVPKLGCQSKTRQFLKIIGLEPLPKDISGEFICHCFDLLLAAATAPAVKVYAMQVLYTFSLHEPDIKNELALILTEKMPDESPGFRTRAKKILEAMRTT